MLPFKNYAPNYISSLRASGSSIPPYRNELTARFLADSCRYFSLDSEKIGRSLRAQNFQRIHI